MKKIIVFILLSGVCAAAEKPADIFTKYDFTKLEPKEIEIKFKKISVSIWDRCTECDCPEPMFGEAKSEETVDQFTYRHSEGIIDGPVKLTGTVQKDAAVIFTKTTEDKCKIDSIITYKEDHPLPKVPCDPGCAEPAKSELTVRTPDLPKAGCSSTGSTWFLLLTIFGISLIRKRPIKGSSI